MSDATQRDEERPPLTETEVAYSRFVPQRFLELLGRPSIVDVELGDHVEQEMSLLFSDIRDFTTLSETMLPGENFRFINSYLSIMEPVVTRHRGVVDKYIGDGIMALFPGAVDDAVRSGIDMLRRLVSYNAGRARAGFTPIRIGVGINTGLVMMGTVGGPMRMESTVIGDAVNLAARIEGLTKNYGAPLIISEYTLHSLVDSSAYCIRFLDRLRLKGRFQAQSVYEVYDADPENLWSAKQQTKPLFEEALAYYHLGRADRALPLLEECLRIAPGDMAARVYVDRCQEAEIDFLPDEANYGMGVEVDWRDEYAIGVTRLDEEHRSLLECIALLAEQVGSRDACAIETLASLGEQTLVHFRDEEKMMRDNQYPFLANHCQHHRSFTRIFTALSEEIQRQERDMLYLLFRIQLMADWLINHTTKNDRHLGYFLQRAGLS